MYNFISLNVKCPLCGESLMSEEHLVDNSPSISLDIKIGDKKGYIRMSSIYGSYNYVSDLEIKQNTLTEFYCPHCHGLMNTEIPCEVCKAPMVPFYLDIGGKVAVCSKAGCKNHFVEFEDLSNALTKFYEDFGFQSKHDHDFLEDAFAIPVDEEKTHTETIASGSFLHTYCPHCKRSMIESDMLKLKIINDNNETGYIFLSPFLNVFSSKSTIFLQEDKVIHDIKCPHCDESLILKEKNCDLCNSPVAAISISARTRLIDFYICSKKGCRWHGLSEDDMNEIKLEDSLDW